MCGICGIFEPGNATPVATRTLKAMADSLRHRGPDDEGFYSGGGIGLAHRRLSIIDLEGGHQPLSNEDGSVWIVFNGEIYNFEELNRRYLSSGHTFKTRSDTETIVHLYEELGEACFAELRGMFAIALWDGRRKRFLLARDRLGKKPVYYSWNGKRLLFGSEIKALWPAGGLSEEMDLEALSDYFSYQYIPAPKTIYRDVRKLNPAHYLVVEGSNMREVPYWDLQFGQTKELSESEWCERFLEEYRTAVKLRLVSDVPLGAFLSGGVDSSSVVALMNEFQPPVTTCSIGFTEESYDGAADARRFAASLGTNQLLPKLAWHYDEPFADSSAVPTYYVSQVAREHVTVALSGDGGDESFAGYRRYKFDVWENRLRSYFPAPLRRTVFGPLGLLYPKLGWAPRVFRGKSTFQSLARDPIEGYFYGISCCPPSQKHQLFSPEAWNRLAGYDSLDVLKYYYDRADTTDPLSRIQYVDIKTYLVDDILVKVDRASMANSLEVRCPLLDHKLVELIAQMPSGLKLHNGKGKYIFKKAMEVILPRDVLTRRKQGFAVPVAEWFRGELKEFAHETIFRRQDGLLNHAYLARCWNQHEKGQRDWSALLWCVLMFRTWQEVCKPA
ncbi:MAG: asparagine synthase (glutamine-hydrolyzing) [Candidatus Solibacter sp.]|nr:asparagine synthase (glutamine-hydrolyzing) [Candidatus Solibacter sp.]